MSVRPALLFRNRKSGGAETNLTEAIACLEEAGYDVAEVFPESLDSLRHRIASAEQATVIVAGGDGTLNAAAPALMTLERPFGILPMGTANDLARSLGIPFDPLAAAKVIVDGESRRIDLGQVDGQPFFNVASIGLSAEVAREHDGELKKRLGVLNYPISAWAAFRRQRPFAVELVIDGERLRRRCVQVAVGNGRHYGGGMTMDEAAEIDDGWLRVYYLKPAGVMAMLRMLPALRFGWLRRAPEAEVKWAKRVELKTRRPRQVNVDGELNGHTPVIVEVLPAAVAVFAPPRDNRGTQERSEREHPA